MEAKALAAEYSIEKSPTKEKALENAIIATELYMKAVQLASSDQERAKLRSKCKQFLSRAEEIKKLDVWIPKKPVQLKAPASERAITTTEQIILLEGSKLHGFIFPPWKEDPDESNFSDGDIYTDGTELDLSDAQRENFGGWQRPREAFGWPPDAKDTDSIAMKPTKDIDLVQDIATDCSVVASLCAGTARASRGHSRLLADMIYPYDKVNLRPRTSKKGKYIFRLQFNGCFRKVVIDDRLPTSNSSRKLHVVDRNNPRLLWPALIEKAYLKARGGYDFPGSNSGTDLWVLSGWIPEQVFLQSDDLQPQQLWNRILKSFGFGDVFVTLGTGKLTRREERELGLAGQHDYAVLDMKEVGPQRLVLVKNPWCDGMVWKGSVIPSSSDSWTESLAEALPNNSPISPGTFWMSFEDIIQHFESLYLNWNPGLFTHRQDHHFSWTLAAINTPGSFTHNPQYAFSSPTKGTVWILLSRHFATGEQAIMKNKSPAQAPSSSALGYISLYVFAASGRRVYLSDDAFHRGAFVDSPQTLAALEVEPSTAYTLVVAQHGLPLPKYAFSLSLFSHSPLAVSQASDSLAHCTTHTGAWTARNAGGNASAPTYPLNPQFSIVVPAPCDITLILETDKTELAVHVKLVWANGERISAVTSRDIVGGSGDYRRGCALASLCDVPAGTYTIVCSTFEARQTGNFTLRAKSSLPCTVKPILAESAGRLSLVLPPVVFKENVNKMLAPLTLSRLTKLRIVARYGRASQLARSRPLLKVSLERGQGPLKSVLGVSGGASVPRIGSELSGSSGGGEFSDALMGIRTTDVDMTPSMGERGGFWIVVERMGGRDGGDDVEVEVLSDGAVSVGLWGTGNG